MGQIHKRFNSEQVKVILEAYCHGKLDRSSVEQTLGINKSRFFALLKQYRHDPEKFSVGYNREASSRLLPNTEGKIRKELLLEKGLIDDPNLAISSYNYSALRDRLLKSGVKVSLPTIIDRAKDLDCYQPHPRKKAHDREVVTTAIGALIQHDASHHQWSPFTKDKWVLCYLYR